MKSSTFYLGITILSFVNFCNASITTNEQYYFFNAVNKARLDVSGFETYDNLETAKREKTAEEPIAEDNAITENNISNETLPLDFNLINKIINVINNQVLFSKKNT